MDLVVMCYQMTAKFPEKEFAALIGKMLNGLRKSVEKEVNLNPDP